MNRQELMHRTKRFAHDCVTLVSRLPSNPLCKIVRYQLLKLGTSSAANYRAACFSQSRASFKAKLSIVIEELDESRFWIEFLRDESFIAPESCSDILMEANELLSIFISARMTMSISKRNA